MEVRYVRLRAVHFIRGTGRLVSWPPFRITKKRRVDTLKILFADKFPEQYQTELTKLGHEITFMPDMSADDLPNHIVDKEVLVVRSTKVTAATIEASNKLALIIRAGAGYNTIDTQAAARKGVFVCNTPGQNSIAVAEVAMGLLISIDRQIPDNVIEMRQKHWDKKRFSKTQGLFGRNIGIVGMGQIGFQVAKRASAFGMNIFIDEETKDWTLPQTLADLAELGYTVVKDHKELAEKCDVLTFHCPATPETEKMVNREFLQHVRPNTILINTSRGTIIDDEALIEAMNEKNIHCGLDVFNDEPTSGKGTINTPLSQHPNVYGTHHIGASTQQAQLAIAYKVVEAIQDFEKGRINNWVNSETSLQALPAISIRHSDRMGILVEILDVIRKEKINIEQVENKNFSGKEAAFTNIYIDSPITDKVIKAIEAIPNVIQVTAAHA
ncbi:MAG: hypothetical protein CSA81_04215 [Acidobacteria bacterium]|nr:MAG: hypothetical protein CSA81_04215 [Acidobacteriota bacterium]